MISRQKHILFMLVITVAFVMLMSCKNNEKPVVVTESMQPDSSIVQSQEMLDGETEIEEYLNSLMEAIKEKESKLKEKDEQLKAKLQELNAKENQLNDIEENLHRYRSVSFIIFLIGILTLIVGLFFIFRKSRGNEKTDSYSSSKSTYKKHETKKTGKNIDTTSEKTEN